MGVGLSTVELDPLDRPLEPCDALSSSRIDADDVHRAG